MISETEHDCRSIIFLDESGDIEIAWEADQDEEMLGIIQKKMNSGVRFFILKPSFGIFKKRVYLTKPEEMTARKVSIRDADIAKMFSDGKVASRKICSSEQLDTVSYAKTPQEVVGNRTMSIRPLSGG